MNNHKLVVLVLILGLSTVNTNGFEGDYDGLITNLSEEEAIQIAMNNVEVSTWLTDSQGEWYRTWFDNNFWYIIFKSTTLNRYIHVIVDDTTEQVASINYPQDSNGNERWYYYDSQNLRDEARDFFLALPEATSFSDFNIDTGYTGNANYVIVNGWRPTSERDDNLNSILRFNQTSTGSFEFTLIFISSNIGFAGANNTMDDALTIASESSYVNDFYGNFSVDDIEIRQWLILENFTTWNSNWIDELLIGTYFEIRYFEWGWKEDYTFKTVGQPTFDHPVDFDMFSHYDNWLGLVVSDDTSKVVYTFGTVLRLLSAEDVLDILLTDPEFVDWFNEFKYVALNINFDGYETIWVDIGTDRPNDWAKLEINDRTGQIMHKNLQKSIPATKTRDNILSIALSDFDISNFVLKVNGYRVNFYYDSRGQWYLDFFDPIVLESYASITINDTDGFVFGSDRNIAPQPQLSQEEVIDIALSTDLLEFYYEFPDAQISMFYGWNNDWQVYVYSPIFYQANVEIIINDRNGNVRSATDNGYLQYTESSKEEIREVMFDDDTFQEFSLGKTIDYETIFFVNSYWYTYVEAYDNESVYYIYESEISDNLWISWSGHHQNNGWEIRFPKGDEIVWGLEDLGNARLTGKQLKTPLADVIERYTPPITETDLQTTDPTKSPSLDLNGFSLIPSLVAIFVMIPIYLKRKR